MEWEGTDERETGPSPMPQQSVAMREKEGKRKDVRWFTSGDKYQTKQRPRSGLGKVLVGKGREFGMRSRG